MTRKLPPSLAWPTNASEVDAVLGEIAEQVHVAWMSWERKPSASPLQATWRPIPPPVIGGSEGDGTSLWIRPVAREEAEEARRRVREHLLPAAKKWLANALAAGEAWQGSRHEASWDLLAGRDL
jgi:hypothetical protein